MEKSGEAVVIKRRGKAVARLAPHVPSKGHEKQLNSWECLRGSGTFLAEPGESVLRDEDFEAMR